MGHLRYIVRRVGFLLITLVLSTVVTFALTKLTPGDPVLVHLGQTAMSDPEIVAAAREKYGLDKPVLQQYWVYLTHLLKGDLGTSIRTRTPVAAELMRFFPASVELATGAVAVAVLLGLLLGVTSAYWRRGWVDDAARVVAVLGVSVPNYWLALLALYVFYFQLGWTAGPGRLGFGVAAPDGTGLLLLDAVLHRDWELLRSAASHLVLPVSVLSLYALGVITRTMRSSLVEVLQQQYVRTARAKGLSERRVVLKHGVRNAILPVLTVVGLTYGDLLGGTVLVETIFSWPGIGRYAYLSVTNLDFPAIMGTTLLITATYAVINFAVDLIYMFVDPRIRYG